MTISTISVLSGFYICSNPPDRFRNDHEITFHVIVFAHKNYYVKTRFIDFQAAFIGIGE